MAENAWIALGRDAHGARAFAVAKSAAPIEARGRTEAEVLKALHHAGEVIVRIGDGTPDEVPCAVLPDTGHVLPALRQVKPAAVLSGWVRLALAGYLDRHADWDGVVCIPEGDVTHWVHLSANEVVSFASFLTVRLVASLGGGAAADTDAIEDSLTRPERLAAHLREAELAGVPDAITGHLIGAELAAARVYWLGQQVVVISPSGSASPYGAALSALGVPVAEHAIEDAIRSGLGVLGHTLSLVAP